MGVLHDVCVKMKNATKRPQTTSKQMFIESILTNRPVAELVEEARQSRKLNKLSMPSISKTKPKIEKGVTYHDLFQWLVGSILFKFGESNFETDKALLLLMWPRYKLQELKEFSKEKGLKTSGRKREVIKRILTFLDKEKESVIHSKKKKILNIE